MAGKASHLYIKGKQTDRLDKHDKAIKKNKPQDNPLDELNKFRRKWFVLFKKGDLTCEVILIASFLKSCPTFSRH